MKYGVWAMSLVVMIAFAAPASALQENPAEEVPEVPAEKADEASPAKAAKKTPDKPTKKDSEKDSEKDTASKESDEEKTEESQELVEKLSEQPVVDTVVESAPSAPEAIQPKAEEKEIVKELKKAPAEKKEEETSVKGDISTASKDSNKEILLPWVGSRFSIENSLNSTIVAKSALLDWRVLYRLNFGMFPLWVYNDMFTFSGRWKFAGSFHTAGEATCGKHECSSNTPSASGQQDASHQVFSSSDLTLSASTATLYTEPVTGVALTSNLDLTLPTSDYSFYSSGMFFGLAAGATASRSFDIVGGLNVRWGLGLNKSFYESLYGSPSKALQANAGRNCHEITTDDSGLARCVIYSSRRKPIFGMDNTLGASMKVNDWLSLAGSLTLTHGFLPGLSEDDFSGVSYSQADSSSVRYGMVESMSATFSAIPEVPYLTVSTGLLGVHGTVGFDGEYQHPFSVDYLNYLRFFVNLNFNVGSLVDEFNALRGESLAMETSQGNPLMARSNQ